MKKRKTEIKEGLATVWLTCLILGMAYWRFIGMGIQSMAVGLVIIGILASLTFLSKGMQKQKRARIWEWCVIFCVFASFMTGAGILFISGLEVDQTQAKAEDVMAEYMEGHGTYINGTKRTIRIGTDAVYRSEIWKMEKGEETEKGEEEWQIVLLLVKITGEDIGNVREILLPISKKELSGSFKEKAGKPTRGPTIALYGGPPIYFP